MRRLLVLSTILGLFLSMVPTVLLAQSATPVAGDSAPTATEVVTEVPTNVPEDVEIATPTVESDQPVGRSSAPESNILAANDPPLTINGVAANRIVPFGINIVVETDTRALLSMYSDAICEGAETPVDNGYEMVADSGKIVSFQASWPNNPGAAPSACLSVTWSVAPTAAPGLTIDGVAANTVVPLVSFINVETVTGAHLFYYDGADCTNNERETDQSSSGFSWGTQYTMSFQAEWDYFPNLPKSPCLSATWGNPLPTAPPSLTIDGVAASKSVAVDDWIIAETDQGAGIMDYSNSTCAGDGYLQDNPLQTSSYIEQTSSFKAVWEDDPSGEGSDCFSVTWGDPGPSVAPSITIDVSSEGNIVPLGTLVTAYTDTGAHIVAYDDANCTVYGTESVVPELSAVWNIETTQSFRAVWDRYADAPQSDCISVTWHNPAPTVAPPLTLDGVASSKTAAIGESVEISTDTYAELYVYFGATNCDGFGPPLNNSQYTDSSDTATSNSYRSVWTGHPGAPQSECLTITWEDPAPTEAPSMTIDGQAASKTVDLNTSVLAETETGAQITLFSDGSCTTDKIETNSRYASFSSDISLTKYFQSEWIGSPDAPKGECLGVTWGDPAPTVAPTLTLDGVAESKTVTPGTSVYVATVPEAWLYWYDAPTCEGPGNMLQDPNQNPSRDEPTSLSYQARWRNFDNAPVSPCLTITWEEPAPTTAPVLTLDGVAENKTLVVGQSVEISTETNAELYVFTGATTCEGTGTPLNDAHFNDSSNTEVSNSYQSMWTGYPNAPKSNCFSVNWAHLPTMTLNDISGDVSVEADSTITFAPQNGSIVFFYRNLDCSGAPFSQTELTNPMENPAGTVYSVRAVTSVEPRLHGDCYVAKWVASPVLMLNGIEGNVTVEVGDGIVFIAEHGAHLKLFATLDCSGTATSEVESGFSSAPSEPTAFSVKAVSNLDDNFTSECYIATWELPPSTPTETPIATPTETAIPTQPPASPTETAVPTETSTPPSQQKQTSIRIEMWDGSDIEGAGWSLFAPSASQVAASPYLTGVFGPNSTAVLTDLPAGEYRFVVAPEGIDSQDFSIMISGESEEIVLQFAQPAMPATPAPEETATVSPTSVAGDPALTTASVTSLPSTGSGSESTPAILGIAGVLAAAMVATLIGSRRRTA